MKVFVDPALKPDETAIIEPLRGPLDRRSMAERTTLIKNIAAPKPKKI